MFAFSSVQYCIACSQIVNMIFIFAMILNFLSRVHISLILHRKKKYFSFITHIMFYFTITIDQFYNFSLYSMDMNTICITQHFQKNHGHDTSLDTSVKLGTSKIYVIHLLFFHIQLQVFQFSISYIMSSNPNFSFFSGKYYSLSSSQV